MINSCLLPENISYFQVSKILLHPINLSLEVELINPITPAQLVTISLSELSYLSLSKVPEDGDGCYLVGDIQLSFCENIKELLENISFELPEITNEHQLYYLHIEGDVCLNVVSKKCQVNEE